MTMAIDIGTTAVGSCRGKKKLASTLKTAWASRDL